MPRYAQNDPKTGLTVRFMGRKVGWKRGTTYGHGGEPLMETIPRSHRVELGEHALGRATKPLERKLAREPSFNLTSVGKAGCQSPKTCLRSTETAGIFGRKEEAGYPSLLQEFGRFRVVHGALRRNSAKLQNYVTLLERVAEAKDALEGHPRTTKLVWTRSTWFRDSAAAEGTTSTSHSFMTTRRSVRPGTTRGTRIGVRNLHTHVQLSLLMLVEGSASVGGARGANDTTTWTTYRNSAKFLNFWNSVGRSDGGGGLVGNPSSNHLHRWDRWTEVSGRATTPEGPAGTPFGPQN